LNAFTKCCGNCGCDPCTCRPSIGDCWPGVTDFENLVTRVIQNLLATSPTVQAAITTAVATMLTNNPQFASLFTPILTNLIRTDLQTQQALQDIIAPLLPQVITAPNVGIVPPILGMGNLQDVLTAMTSVIVGGGMIMTGDASGLIFGNIPGATFTMTTDVSGTATASGTDETVGFSGDMT
jgi:hypothetical protein